VEAVNDFIPPPIDQLEPAQAGAAPHGGPQLENFEVDARPMADAHDQREPFVAASFFPKKPGNNAQVFIRHILSFPVALPETTGNT
jgi:hypothetical protein